MSTTDILFNSPALNSLKRIQLVQLCKHHNIKSTGKNNELVSRLKEHARALPSDAPLNIAVRSENDFSSPMNSSEGDDNSENDGVEEESDVQNGNLRPSQMWNPVMDDITELSEGTANSKKSVSSSGSAGEFGTSNSKCTSL
jgi:hypothetical protein